MSGIDIMYSSLDHAACNYLSSQLVLHYELVNLVIHCRVPGIHLAVALSS